MLQPGKDMIPDISILFVDEKLKNGNLNSLFSQCKTINAKTQGQYVFNYYARNHTKINWFV